MDADLGGWGGGGGGGGAHGIAQRTASVGFLFLHLPLLSPTSSPLPFTVYNILFLRFVCIPVLMYFSLTFLLLLPLMMLRNGGVIFAYVACLKYYSDPRGACIKAV